MKRELIFTFRISQDERDLITYLAQNLKRSQSDAVRFVAVEAARQLSQTDIDSTLAMQAQAVKLEGKNVSK